ncbi:MAG TPA: hypothetical protein VGM90_18885 [Kofleriaceae bacterium]
MKVRVILLALFAGAAGCELIANIPSSNSNRPDGSMSGDDASASGDDAGSGSDAMNECTTNVECTTAAKPTCDNHVCRECRIDAECGANGVCLLDGTCAAEARILYVAPTGSGAVCSAAAPCSLDTSVASLSATKDVIKLAAATYTLTTSIKIKPAIPVTMAGEGATLVGGADPLNFMVESNGPGTTITGITFDEQTWYAGYCEGGKVTYSRTTWLNGGLGFFSTAQCDFTLDYSVVKTQAAYAGYFSNGASIVHIRNSMLVDNGTAGNANPVFTISGTGTTGAVENTTIAGNHGSTNSLVCVAGITARNVISFGNAAPPTNECVVSYSDIEAGYGGANDHNVTLDPQFVSATDFHLQAASPVRGIGDPAAVLPLDVDLQVRPQPAGTAPDLGADEVP